MNFLNEITFKKIAKLSLIFFTFCMFPLAVLLLFYESMVSVLGLLFSYVSLFGAVVVIYALFYIKNNVFDVIKVLPEKINSIVDERVSNYFPILMKIGALVISIVIVYATLSIGSLFLNFISLISVLNPVMIIILNIYYVIMGLVFEGDNI